MGVKYWFYSKKILCHVFLVVFQELNAQLAAEKLAERLHIKMEEYNPEGTDMSYRVTKGNGYTDDIDSDDDIDEDVENASYSKTLVPSDTED
ncbi:DNA-directed RNA polymerase II subunit GRINL1A-like [Ruditapes philippinarum]|uniref:DNA-directed RNA polymerase II subunit GRINL1A-like n=1 Tax=Ruditapes philippinarum TaxID=129788 RepID=UPI00295B5260|nr:DNA-directed RNA polymerase II subunit GRINL1A-like [Ruditapes philippinarum]